MDSAMPRTCTIVSGTVPPRNAPDVKGWRVSESNRTAPHRNSMRKVDRDVNCLVHVCITGTTTGSGSHENTPAVLQALLADAAAFAFAQPGVPMPPKPIALEDADEDDDDGGDEDEDEDEKEAGGGGASGGAKRGAAAEAVALRAKLEREAAAAEAAAATAAALALIQIPKATAAEQLRLVKSLVKMAFRLPGRKGFLGESRPTLDKEGFVTFLEHFSVAEAMLDKVFVEGMGFPNPRSGRSKSP